MNHRMKPDVRDAIAPDGSDVRVLIDCAAGGMAHFTLAAGETSVAVVHRTVEELWYFVAGEGEMWRKSERTGKQTLLQVRAGMALSIPNHTLFQFRSTGSEPLEAVAVTMPPWPGIGDMDGTGEVSLVKGKWTATVSSGMC